MLMFRFTPTHLLNLLRCCRPLAVALIIATLAGCGGQATRVNEPANPPADPSIEFNLPPLHELIAGSPRNTSLTTNANPSVNGDAYILSGGNVSKPGGNAALIQAPVDGISYAIYRFSDLAEKDKLKSVTIDSAADGSEAEFEYYLLYSDYTRGSWKAFSRQQFPGVRTINIDYPGRQVGSSGMSYVAVVACNSAALKVAKVTAHFDFFGRTAPHHIVTSLPGRDAAGVDIRFNLEAMDESGEIKTEFNGPAVLSGSPFGMTVPEQPAFVAGLATATINFSGSGTFSVSIDGVGDDANGSLGIILIHTTALPVYEISIAEDHLASLDADPWSDEYYPAHITLEGQQFPGIRVRYRGGTTRTLPKKNWKVKLNSTLQYADPDWGYDNKTLNINAQYSDPTLMRDKLCYDVFEDLNVLTPRSRFVHLRVNDEFFGVYVQVEQPRKDWLTSFGVNPEGPLYEAKNSNLEELGAAANYVGLFDKELKELEPYDDLASFVSAFNNWPAGSFNSQFTATIDAGNYLNYMVANTLISQGDHMFKNYLLYLDRAGTGRWYIVPWDNDLTWGRQWSEELELFDYTPHYGLPIDYGIFIDGGSWGNFLMDRWLNDPSFTVQYEAAIGDALDNYFTEEEFIGRVDEAYNLILPDVMADPQRYTGGIDYDVWVEELREYVRQRRIRLADYIL